MIAASVYAYAFGCQGKIKVDDFGYVDVVSDSSDMTHTLLKLVDDFQLIFDLYPNLQRKW